MGVWVIIVAGGSGTRFGGGKQFEMIGDRRVLDWSIDGARSSADGIVVVLGAEHIDEVAPTLDVDEIVAGGATRSESVRAGLGAVPEDAEIILVHDSARPLATRPVYAAVIQAVRDGADAAVPGIAVVDTVKRIDGHTADHAPAAVIETVDRSNLIAVQTPQAFSADALRQAHAARPDASDDAGVVEVLGGKVVAVQGDPANMKITLPHDMVLVRALAAR